MTKARNFQIRFAYHVYNRGNQKEKIFLIAKDYNAFIKELNKYAEQFYCEVLGYCIMPNHYHLILVPLRADSIPKLMHRVSSFYSRYLRNEYNWIGHVFQRRYNAKLVKSQSQLNTLARYLENNPVEAKLVRESSEYRWLKLYRSLIKAQLMHYNPGVV